MRFNARIGVCFPYHNSWTCRVSSSDRQRLLPRTSSAALLLLLLAFVFAPTVSPAQVAITVPGSTSPNIQITGAVPMRAVVNSGNSFAVDHVQVLDGTTQIGIYTGNGSTSMDLRGVFALSAGTHTMTVTETDTNHGTQSASATFVVASTGDVTQSPTPDSESPSPVSWQATCTANSGQVITTMKVYLDFPSGMNPTPLASFTQLNQSSVTESQSFNSSQIPNGPHALTTNCWDGAGQVYQSSVDFTVGTSFPSPSGSSVALNLDNPSAGWTDCLCSGDAGGTAGTHTDTYPALPSGGFPTIDNDSRDFSITTTTSNPAGKFQGDLWYTSFSNSGSQFASGYPVNWIFDYYVVVENPLIGLTNVEFDGNQTNGLSSGGYVLGTQCNLGVSQSGNIWRFWDNGSWNGANSAVSCPLTAYGHWFHVQMYFTLNVSARQYTVQNIRVTDTSINSVVLDVAPALTFTADSVAHGNSIDVQLDGYGNHTFPVTYDKINVIRW